MKRYGLLFGLFLMAFVCWAQQGITYQEVVVKAPTYGADVEYVLEGNEMASPIGQYLNFYLTREAILLQTKYSEGTVIVDFTVHPNGTIDHFIVQNSVSKITDQAVLSALKSTNGDWIAGEKDGTPVEMKKRIVISFSDNQTASLEQQARLQYKIGLKKFFDAKDLENDFFLTKEQICRKKERKLNLAINRFDYATRLTPNEKSIVYWEMKAYAELGIMKMQQQLERKLQELVIIDSETNTDCIAINF